jgi:hypothetical protein
MNFFRRNRQEQKVEKKQQEEVICIDCDKKTQKDLPTADSLSSKGKACENEYTIVAACMTENEGQVSSCTKQWDSFKLCHEQQKHTRT